MQSKAISQSEPVEGLVHALVLDGKGAARSLSWDELEEWKPEDGPLWAHFDYSHSRVQSWIDKDSGLDEIVSAALLTEETRPRTTPVDNGLLIALRGVNLNPNSDPEDMISIRMWVDSHRIISTRRRRILSIQDMTKQLRDGDGPCNTAEVLTGLCDLLVWRMSSIVAQVEERVDELEEEVLTAEGHRLRSDLADTRRQTIMLRRYLGPQRDALARLVIEKVGWLNEDHRMKLREVSDRLIRHLEDLEAVRERAAVTQEELAGKLAEQLNNRMYVLSVVAALFLPLGFLTGLLGINIGGIPGADEPYAFMTFIAILVVITAAQYWVFRKMKWF